MFPIHRILDMRMCGALTQGLGLNTNVLVNNMLAAVQGDVDSHNMLGALQPIMTKVLINGIPAVPAISSMAQTDILGIIPHVTGLPIPVTGSQNVMIGQGSMGAGLGMMQNLGFGNFGGLQIGELVSMGGQVVGMVQNFTGIGGGAAVAQISNLQGAPLTSGSTVTGQTSGYSFTFANYFDSRVASSALSYPSIDTVSNALVSDTGEYIVIQDYYNYPNMNLTSSVITT